MTKKNDKTTIDSIKDVAQTIYTSISKQKAPDMKLPIRSLSNVKYSGKDSYFEIGKAVKKRTLSVNTVKAFAQLLEKA